MKKLFQKKKQKIKQKGEEQENTPETDILKKNDHSKLSDNKEKRKKNKKQNKKAERTTSEENHDDEDDDNENNDLVAMIQRKFKGPTAHTTTTKGGRTSQSGILHFKQSTKTTPLPKISDLLLETQKDKEIGLGTGSSW